MLNVGCGDGAETRLLARCGGREVVGTNHSDTLQGRFDSGSEGPDGPVEPAGATAAITFLEDDISASSLESVSFDVACSWRTIEHLTAPAAAMAEMARLLRPGGYAFHEYNPFFCIEGGHSLCTLDFPWGHVRLAADDFERYLEAYRPDEATVATDYYYNGLNRLSLDEMHACCREAGFEVLCFVPRTRTEDLMALDKSIIDQARRVYPSVTINDLVSRMVRLVLRKPRA